VTKNRQQKPTDSLQSFAAIFCRSTKKAEHDRALHEKIVGINIRKVGQRFQ